MFVLISKLWLLLITILTAFLTVAFLHEAFLNENPYLWLGAFVFGNISIYARRIYLSFFNHKETEEE